MKDKKTSGYINRYILGWATKIIIAFFIIVILIFVFFRWTGAITKTPFSWKRPTIELVHNKSSSPITQRTNQLWVNAKFKKHHSKINDAVIYVEDEEGELSAKPQELIQGSNTYTFSGISSGHKKIYSHISWSLYGDKTYYLGDETMNDITTLNVRESSINKDVNGLSFYMDTDNPRFLFTMLDMKNILPSEYYNDIVEYLNTYVFQPWLGVDYQDLISGTEKDDWINMPLAFNFLVSDEHELSEIYNTYNNDGIDGLKKISKLPKKIFSSLIPQPYIFNDEKEIGTSIKNLIPQKGENKYKFNSVLTNDHKFVSLKDYANKKTNFKLAPLGLAYRINDDGKKIPYIVTSGNIIKLFALGTPEMVTNKTIFPAFFQVDPSIPLTLNFFIALNNYEFSGDEKVTITIKQEGEDAIIKNLVPYVINLKLSDIYSGEYSPGINYYMYQIDEDYLKNTDSFNTLDSNGKPLKSIFLSAKIEINYEESGESLTLSTDFYSEAWHGEQTKKDLEIRSLSKNITTTGELNSKPYQDYKFQHPDWIQFESSSPFPLPDYLRLNWKQAYWKTVPKNKFRIEFKFVDQFDSRDGLLTNWFSVIGEEDEMNASDIASTTGKPDHSSKPWDIDIDNVFTQYDDNDEKLVEESTKKLYETSTIGGEKPKDLIQAKSMLFSNQTGVRIRIIGKSSFTDFWDDQEISIGEYSIFNLNDSKPFWLFDAKINDDDVNE